MQVRAIIEAGDRACKRTEDGRARDHDPAGRDQEPNSTSCKARIDAMAQAVKSETGVKLNISVGTMIEMPRAALTADEIARRGRLLQLRHERPDADDVRLQPRRLNTFLPDYTAQGHLPRDPFRSLDRDGVGQLVEMGVKKGRSAKPGLKCGICGEHGGDPDSIVFCHKVGLDYVSLQPVPRADRPAGRRASGARQEGRWRGLSRMRTREFVRYAGIAIEVIAEGQGSAIVLLPSLARDSEDYDAVAEGLAAAGYSYCVTSFHPLAIAAGAPQQGQRGRIFMSAWIKRTRMVAIELGIWRSGREGGSSGSITFG